MSQASTMTDWTKLILMATFSLDREGMSLQWSGSLCKFNLHFMVKLWRSNSQTLFPNLLKSREQHLNISLFVLSYLSLYCKVGHDYNSWLVSRSAFVIFVISSNLRALRYLQRQNLLLLQCIYSIRVLDQYAFHRLFYFICWAEKCVKGIYSNHFSKWMRAIKTFTISLLRRLDLHQTTITLTPITFLALLNSLYR